MMKSLAAVAMVTGLSLMGLSLSPTAALAHDPKPLPAVSASDRVLGRADAPVTVVEYASFTCNHCAQWHNTILPSFKTRYIDTGKVRLVFRDMPTQPVQIAATAAAVGRCAAPGKFFDVAHHLMGNQSSAFASGQVTAWFDGAVAASGRTPEQIDACLADPATSTNLHRDIQAAIDAGVQGTPFFFVNGRAISGHSLEALSAAIDPLLRGR